MTAFIMMSTRIHRGLSTLPSLNKQTVRSVATSMINRPIQVGVQLMVTPRIATDLGLEDLIFAMSHNQDLTEMLELLPSHGRVIQLDTW
ncbi:MAG: hypothetical protein A2511_12405 [Deltaproteobacteria bacterium RIFOXYD12_FULL_50_9]|nr:MAG: hypothetical protein A2511_12405 [Deltaproteobacteria bacterium RIFOXYD12_FULL_50_9]